jgi:uncharacterized SAM-dependent methyltransferase
MKRCNKPDTYFDLIELGAGDGLKPKNFWENSDYKLDYMPVDISQNALDNLEVDLNNELPTHN